MSLELARVLGRIDVVVQDFFLDVRRKSVGLVDMVELSLFESFYQGIQFRRLQLMTRLQEEE